MFKLNENANVYPQLMEHSRKEIEATNTFVSNLKGTCVAIHTIRHGQPRPYADHAYEALIVCIQPNSKTTNAPLPRVIDIDAAKTLARLFVHPFIEKTSDEKWASPQLQFIRPEPNPCGLDDGEYHKRTACRHAGTSLSRRLTLANEGSMTTQITINRAPCQSCPYRRDVPSGIWSTETWCGKTFEHAAQRLLDCKYPNGKVIAWRYPSCVVTTTPIRGSNYEH